MSGETNYIAALHRDAVAQELGRHKRLWAKPVDLAFPGLFPGGAGNEDLSWLRYLPKDWSVVAYNTATAKRDFPDGVKVVLLPNIGREAGQFAYHLAHNYGRLADLPRLFRPTGNTTRNASTPSWALPSYRSRISGTSAAGRLTTSERCPDSLAIALRSSANYGATAPFRHLRLLGAEVNSSSEKLRCTGCLRPTTPACSRSSERIATLIPPGRPPTS